ncbi:MAG TPA: lysine--tRNA ligase [Candidatus Marinimicrobia bacterium]|nr:lysine--tRNA ligase [Candidatus Neomarinimicrobiota bacterium]
MEAEHKNLQEIIRFRLEKLEKIKNAGINPYAYNFDKKDSIESLIQKGENGIGEKVMTAGRMVSFRKMGKASFTHIQDENGKIQIYLKNDLLPESIYDNIVRNLDLGDIIGCTGELFVTKMGELSIKADNINILSKNIRPLPNMKEKEGESFNAFEDKELRYRHRQLDLIANPSIKAVFKKRAKIISSIRKYLDDNNFIEVETPVLQPVYGGASARPFTTFHNTLEQPLYLRIADELYLKRLIVGGFEKVYELAKNFRNEGMDRNHNPEYTSLEFYQAYSDIYEMMEFTEKLFKQVAEKTGDNILLFGGHTIDFKKPFLKNTMFDLLQEYTKEDLSEMDENELTDFAKSKSIDISDGMNYGQVLDKIFGELVEPHLIEPIFVTDYPKAISPLAKEDRNGKADIVERFELFIAGMEFANAFSELNDPIEQRIRLESQAKLRDSGDEEAQIVDENFLQAMEIGMPPTGGVGIGVDRLVMLLTQQESIKDVILFPAMRHEDK